MEKKNGKTRKSLFGRIRFYTAASSAFLMNLNIFGVSMRGICTPGFNCHGCPWATFACPIGVFTFSSAVRELPVMAIGFILAVGMLAGRLVCGFFCPFGWFQDILHRIPSPKIKIPRIFNWCKYGFLLFFVILLPYFLGFEKSGYLEIGRTQVDQDYAPDRLVISGSIRNAGDKTVHSPSVDVVFIDNYSEEEVYRKRFTMDDLNIPPGEVFDFSISDIPNHLYDADLLLSSPQSKVVQTPKYGLYFCRICPDGILTASLPAKFAESQSDSEGVFKAAGWFSPRFLFLYAVLILMVLSSRPFCRVMCPLGAIYGLMSKISLAQFEFNNDKCTGCGLCDKVCPAGLDVRKEIGGMECIACGDCISICPENALKRKFALASSCRRETAEEPVK